MEPKDIRPGDVIIYRALGNKNRTALTVADVECTERFTHVYGQRYSIAYRRPTRGAVYGLLEAHQKVELLARDKGGTV